MLLHLSLSFVYPPEDIVSIHPGLLHRAHEQVRNPSILDILVLTPMRPLTYYTVADLEGMKMALRREYGVNTSDDEVEVLV